MILIPAIILLSVFTSNQPARAQTVDIRPESDKLNQYAIEAHTARYDIQRGGEHLGHAIVDLSERRSDGSAAFRLTWDLHFAGQTVTDQSTFLRDSFSPTTHLLPAAANGSGQVVSLYGADEVSGAIVTADSTSTFTNSFSGDVFEGGIHHLILASLDLAVADTFHVHVGAATSETTMKATRVKSEIIETAGRSYETIKLDVDTGAFVMSTWISHEAPYLIRREIPSADMEWTLAETYRSGSWTDARN